MNIKISKSEAVSLIAPTLRDKFYPASVTVEIEEPAPYPTFVPVPVPVDSRVNEIARLARNQREQGGISNKISLIKEIRNVTGLGLRDAKNLTEALFDFR